MQTRIMNRVQPCECLASPRDSGDKANRPRTRRLREVNGLSDLFIVAVRLCAKAWEMSSTWWPAKSCSAASMIPGQGR